MKKEIYLVLNNIRSAHNVGSIFRTADAAGVKHIYLCGITPKPATKDKERATGSEAKVAKTALGAERLVSWSYHKQTLRLIKSLQAEGVHTAALEQHSRSKNLFSYQPEFPLALVVGHERKGLDRSLLKYADVILEIPMFGQKESLNVSVAAGIALYHIAFKPKIF